MLKFFKGNVIKAAKFWSRGLRRDFFFYGVTIWPLKRYGFGVLVMRDRKRGAKT